MKLEEMMALIAELSDDELEKFRKIIGKASEDRLNTFMNEVDIGQLYIYRPGLEKGYKLYGVVYDIYEDYDNRVEDTHYVMIEFRKRDDFGGCRLQTTEVSVRSLKNHWELVEEVKAKDGGFFDMTDQLEDDIVNRLYDFYELKE
jgi:hypothetical protein